MEYKHFSHEHNLTLYQVQLGQQQQQQLHCAGCDTPCDYGANVYACWPCNFFLHDHCGGATRYIRHPYHTLHPLTLLPLPTYSNASFLCNACGKIGTSFSYCCPLCEVDLHVPCAFLPPKAHNPAHPHELCLSRPDPERPISHTICKLCNQMVDPKQWSYYCLKCDFRVHTFCGTKEVKARLYQVDEAPETVASALAPLDTPASATAPASAAGKEEVGPKVGGCDEASKVEPAGEQPKPVDPVVELYRLQMEMQMANQLAQMMASFNPASLV